MDSFNISAPSPDGLHTAHLAVGGEIRFGPLYFSLSVDGRSFGERIFGDAHLWSPASTLFAAQALVGDALPVCFHVPQVTLRFGAEIYDQRDAD